MLGMRRGGSGREGRKIDLDCWLLRGLLPRSFERSAPSVLGSRLRSLPTYRLSIR